MSAFFRLIKILHVFGRYRLDTLLNDTGIAKRFKPILFPFRIYPNNKDGRGLRLRRALEELGPIFVKFGQLLSTRPDIIAPDIIEELSHLQDNVTPFDNNVFQDIVERALGQPVERLFATFSHTPLASASVAQVHSARLKEGDDVIIKVIRPGIDVVIEQDIKLLLFLARSFERMSINGRRFRPVEVVEDYRNTIFDELDLTHEASNASQLRRNFENSDQLYVPKVYWEYSKSHIMVMERIYGIPITDLNALREQNTNFRLLAERGVEIFFTQVFDHNFFHADMHPGNIFVSRENPSRPSYIAIDMAIVGSLTREDQYYLARNLVAMFRRDYRQVAELHVQSGWVPDGTSISGFESAIRAVCEPIFEKPLKDISFGEALITLFRTAQRYNMPVQPQLVLLQKTLLNIEGLGRQLYPDLNLWDTAHPFLERWVKKRFHPKTLWQEFRYSAPELVEKLPQLPHMALESLEHIKVLSESAPKILAANQSVARSQRNKRRLRVFIALVAVGCAVAISWPKLRLLEIESALLLFIALIALLT